MRTDASGGQQRPHLIDLGGKTRLETQTKPRREAEDPRKREEEAAAKAAAPAGMGRTVDRTA
ncbi:hypothetical protein [Prosthecomicrobium sp. N25]|uniref:hypothetical protein n=1 Tax=Prosthecomicrobium sp. N25 TaxID=3129254 RepID=UPI003077A942